jgi:Fe-S cluster assembly iron-binding protein IscA
MSEPLPPPEIEVTDKAKERLRAALAREASARAIRIDVGRG